MFLSLIHEPQGLPMFILDPRLEADSLFVTMLSLSQVRLNNDQRYPWLILIPAVNDIKELIDLNHEQQGVLLQEMNLLSHLIKTLWCPDKMNIATLGNVVGQFHIHIIGRFTNDSAWPQPVWGRGNSEKYLASEANTLIMRVQHFIKQSL